MSQPLVPAGRDEGRDVAVVGVEAGGGDNNAAEAGGTSGGDGECVAEFPEGVALKVESCVVG